MGQFAPSTYISFFWILTIRMKCCSQEYGTNPIANYRTFVVLVHLKKNLETMIENDMKFHESIARCNRNSLLVATLEIMIEYWLGSIRDNFRTRAEKDFRLFDQNITEHNQIIEAIRERKPDATSKAMTNHILSATKRL